MADLFGKLVVRSYAPKRRALLLAAAASAGRSCCCTARSSSGATTRASGSSIRCAAPCRRAQRIRDAGGRKRAAAHSSSRRRRWRAASIARATSRWSAASATCKARSRGSIRTCPSTAAWCSRTRWCSVKVQQMQIVPETAAGQYRLKFVLMQSGKPDGTVTGNASITIDGLQQGKPHEPEFGAGLAQAARQPGILVPLLSGLRRAAAVARRIRADARGRGDSRGRDTSHSFRQAFVWKAQGMSVETDAHDGACSPRVLSDVQAETE